MTTWNVTKVENRQGGYSDHVGTVEAANEEQALLEAEARFDCPTSCSLLVEEATDE